MATHFPALAVLAAALVLAAPAQAAKVTTERIPAPATQGRHASGPDDSPR